MSSLKHIMRTAVLLWGIHNRVKKLVNHPHAVQKLRIHGFIPLPLIHTFQKIMRNFMIHIEGRYDIYIYIYIYIYIHTHTHTKIIRNLMIHIEEGYEIYIYMCVCVCVCVCFSVVEGKNLILTFASPCIIIPFK